MTDKTTIVVTGSSGGVGTAICSAMINAGYLVLGLDIAEPVQPNPSLTFAKTNLAIPEEIESALSKAPSPVGAVIQCAAVQPLVGAGAGAPLAVWQETYAVNVLSLEFIASELKASLSATPPHRIIAIGSVHEKVTSRDIAPYSVSKAALAAWVRAASLDLGPAGITTIGISAGAIDTAKLEEGLQRFENPANARARMLEAIPARHLLSAQAIASLATFLLLPEASHFQGTNLCFDGGVSEVLAGE